jgi:UDP-N-acetylglucosamine:LPS N-acetylglucosamine transferase
MILYISRGQGFQHAMMDLQIFEELQRFNPPIDCRFASYADGQQAFGANGLESIDLNLTADGDMSSQAIIALGSLIRETAPTLVVSHEVFMSLPLAKVFGVPAYLLTHWFFEAIDRRNPLNEFVKSADHILFTDIAEFHTVPSDFSVPVSFVGPVIRKWNWGLENRDVARKELGFAPDEKVVLITVGGRHSRRVGIIEAAVKAYEKSPLPNKRLVLLAGPLQHHYRQQFGDRKDILIKDFEWQIDKLVVASDLVICAGSFTTLWELAFLGIPSIAIPDKENVVDHQHAANMQRANTTCVISENTLSADSLLSGMRSILDDPGTWNAMSNAGLRLASSRGQQAVARVIHQAYQKLGGDRVRADNEGLLV